MQEWRESDIRPGDLTPLRARTTMPRQRSRCRRDEARCTGSIICAG